MKYQVQYENQSWIPSDIEATSPLEAAQLYLAQDSNRRYEDYDEVIVFWGGFGKQTESFLIHNLLASIFSTTEIATGTNRSPGSPETTAPSPPTSVSSDQKDALRTTALAQPGATDCKHTASSGPLGCRLRRRWVLLALAAGAAVAAVLLWNGRDATATVWVNGQPRPCPKRFLIPPRERNVGGNMAVSITSPAQGSGPQLDTYNYAIKDLNLVWRARKSGVADLVRDFPISQSLQQASQPAVAVLQWESSTKWDGGFVPAAALFDNLGWVGNNKNGFRSGNDICLVFKGSSGDIRICYLSRRDHPWVTH